MERVNKRRASKHGAASIFLAIIMSALILVECTFVAFVWNLDYALTVNTALKSQIDTILSDYNRLLFDVYGIYAFNLDVVDDCCFNKALEINGLESRAELYVSGAARFTTADLKKAVNSYYWHRGPGVSFRALADGYSELFTELDKNGYLKQISQFMRSPAADYVSRIIKGTESAEEWAGKAGDLINLEEVVSQITDMDSIRNDYRNAVKDFELDLDIDIAEWDGIVSALSTMEKALDYGAGISDPVMTKFYISHYCAYNFDCWIAPHGDESINGTEFKSFHDKNKADAEYIITGLGTVPAVIGIEMLIMQILTVANILKDYANEKIRNTIYAVAQVISWIILAVSEGTADIDPRLIAAGLTLYVSCVQALKDFNDVLQGGRAVIFEYDNVKMVTFSYRDFLYLFCLCTKEEDLLARSYEILERDFGELYKGIKLEADFRGSTYSVEKSYQLYE